MNLLDMKLIDEIFGAIKIIQLEKYEDNRGSFSEVFRADKFAKFGIPHTFLQENQSISHKNVIRGLHLQYLPKQGKLIRVIQGIAQFVELDFRPGNTFGKHIDFIISADDNLVLWVPFGFANGFAALSDKLIVNYKVTEYWNAFGEISIKYNSPELDIKWKVQNPIVSDKDQNAITFMEFTQKILPHIEF